MPKKLIVTLICVLLSYYGLELAKNKLFCPTNHNSDVNKTFLSQKFFIKQNREKIQKPELLNKTKAANVIDPASISLTSNVVSQSTLTSPNNTNTDIANNYVRHTFATTRASEYSGVTAYRSEDSIENSLYYLPYIQVGNSHYFSNTGFNITKVDLFIPIWQTPNRLIFTDIRVGKSNNSEYEGNFHLGYRQLSQDNKKLFGVYVAYDHRMSEIGNYFDQFTFGMEYWHDNWFIGGNIYRPIGKIKLAVRHSGEELVEERQGGYTRLWLKSHGEYIRAMSGVDAEVGREFIRGLIGY